MKMLHLFFVFPVDNHRLLIMSVQNYLNHAVKSNSVLFKKDIKLVRYIFVSIAKPPSYFYKYSK